MGLPCLPDSWPESVKEPDFPHWSSAALILRNNTVIFLPHPKTVMPETRGDRGGGGDGDRTARGHDPCLRAHPSSLSAPALPLPQAPHQEGGPRGRGTQGVAYLRVTWSGCTRCRSLPRCWARAGGCRGGCGLGGRAAGGGCRGSDGPGPTRCAEGSRCAAVKEEDREGRDDAPQASCPNQAMTTTAAHPPSASRDR